MDAVQEVKDRLSIEDLVGHYVDLKRSGASLKGLCPFHQEKTPSFYVTPARGTYHCFGCGRGGDAFSFLMELEKMSFPDALKQLASQAGVRLPEREARQPSLSGRLFEANAAAQLFFENAMNGAPGERARRYLVGRQFDTGAIEMFGLGYSPDGRDLLYRHLRSEGFEDRILLAAGLIFQDEIGEPARDRFRGRLMFPIRDRAGKIVGFGGRALGDAQPKYLNSPQTEIFDKSGVLFGIHRAQDAVRTAGKAILVEGYLDAVRAHVGGYPNTVASLGTAVTVQQLTILSRLAETAIVALDPDPAGMAAAARTSLTALAELTGIRGRSTGAAAALDLRIARLPGGGGDPDQLIREQPDQWEQVLADSVPALDFYFTQTMASLDRASAGWRQEAIDRLLPLVQQFGSSAGWQAMWVQRLASETGIDPRTLQRTLPSNRSSPSRRRGPSQSDAARSVVTDTTARALTWDPVEEGEHALLALLFQLVLLPNGAVTLLQSWTAGQQEHRSLMDALFEWQPTGSYDYEMFRGSLPAELIAEADDLHAKNVPLPQEGKVSLAVAFHLARIQYFRLEAELKRATQVLGDVAVEDKAGALASVANLMKRRQDVEQDLERLSRQIGQSTGSAHD